VPAVPARTPRNESIDCLRGGVMILMALDHTRDFFGTSVDMHTAPLGLWLTRWVTHYCAPVFVYLAGMSAWLHGRRLSTASLSAFLLKRGLWLVLLEVTVVRVAWSLQFGPGAGVLQVIWVIGMAMIALAALVWLPRAVVGAIALAVVVGHNYWDPVQADALGDFRWLWVMMHDGGPLAPFEGARWFVAYPAIPWIAVMAGGYAMGPWALRSRAERRARFLGAGLAVTAGFLVLRATNLYGDPHAWNAEGGPLRAAMSFLDCQKYPPSLLYLAMTLGPAWCVLAWLDRPLGPWATRVATYGRVPLFYYVLHLFLLHGLAIVLAWPVLGSEALTRQYMPFGGLAWPLPGVYAMWITVVLMLYPACRWFADVKRRSSSPWMSYL
jgi:uncharacterized membrane protein